MCGILGIYHSDNQPVSRELLQRMNGTMAHRGPDGAGVHLEPGLAIAHRRLSIIDLSGGTQPMCNEDETIWITFNGEIYNFRELHRSLEARGHRFRTVSDTEVIVHAYEEYGDCCVNHLRGMFAFAVWDRPRRRLLLARDRVGIKPLYYYCDGQQLIFASELKALLVSPIVPRRIDPEALKDYLSYGYIPLTGTIFENIHKLLPGHYAIAQRQPGSELIQLGTERYWDLSFQPEAAVSEQDWIEGLRQVLLESIQEHMISDVPLGAFLSGGLDSSCVVALMSQVSSAPVKTFSIGFEEDEFSELPFARQVASRFQTEHHELIVKPDAVELLPLLARQFDEPFGDSSAIPTYYVSRLARDHVTVVLSGDGGDEAFAGYHRYANTMAALAQQQYVGFLPAKFRKCFFDSIVNQMPRHTRGRGLLRRLGMSSFETYMDIAYHHEPAYLENLLHGDVKGVLSGSNGSGFAEYFDRLEASDELTRMQYLDTKTYLPEDILTKVDRASMLTSLEARVPLLDHRVLEFAARVPASLKFRHGQGKYIFKRFLRELLPEPLINRVKMGFGLPLVHWFRTDLMGYTREVLFSQRSQERGFFDRQAIESILVEHRRVDRSPDIWKLLFFEHWCQHYLDCPITGD